MKYININRFFLAVLALSVMLSSFLAYADNTKEDISETVLRLHVIANSDSAADQALKLKVRDRILAESGEIFKETQSRKEAVSKAKEYSSVITAAARDEILKNGCDYDVRIETGNFSFPQKRYGQIFLPAGNYDAVRVIIGSGEGENWWCVMFPPLCFTQGTVKLSEESKAYLKAGLSEGEYSFITDSSNEADIELRFKILEILSALKEKGWAQR